MTKSKESLIAAGLICMALIGLSATFPGSPGVGASPPPQATMTRFFCDSTFQRNCGFQLQKCNGQVVSSFAEGCPSTFTVTESVPCKAVAPILLPCVTAVAKLKRFYCDSTLTDQCGFQWTKCTGEVVNDGCQTSHSTTESVSCTFIPELGVLCPLSEASSTRSGS